MIWVVMRSMMDAEIGGGGPEGLGDYSKTSL
jgi:hypothetical protein